MALPGWQRRRLGLLVAAVGERLKGARSKPAESVRGGCPPLCSQFKVPAQTSAIITNGGNEGGCQLGCNAGLHVCQEQPECGLPTSRLAQALAGEP